MKSFALCGIKNRNMDKISIYCSGNRPHLWHNFRSLEDNKTEFEIIFVGDRNPDFELLPYMKFIYSTVKPSQCSYIAAKNADGNYLLNLNDDLIVSPHCLDNMLRLLKTLDETSTIISMKYFKKCLLVRNGFLVKHHPGTEMPGDMLISTASLTSRHFFDRYIIDKNFIGVCWDMDISMENNVNGGQVVICQDTLVMDIECTNAIKSWGDYEYFLALWTTDGRMVCNRTSPRDPIVDSDDILTVSQGRKGKWD